MAKAAPTVIADSLVVRAVAARDEHDILFADDAGDVTVAAMLRFAEAFDASLRSCFLDRQSRICVVMPAGRLLAMTIVTAMSVSACAPLDPRLTLEEFTTIFDDLRADAVVSTIDYAPAARAAAQRRGMTILEVAEPATITIAQNSSARPVEHAPGHALLLHTSGTTSRPKLVGLTEENLLSSARSIAATLRLGPADRCLNVMPLFHIHGIVGVVLSSIVGGSSIELASRFDPFAYRRQLGGREITWTSAVPSIYRAALTRSAPERAEPLRFLRSSSAPLPTNVWQHLEATFQCPVVNSYGMTEASHQMTSNPLPPDERRLGTVGPSAGSEVSILEDGHVTDVRGVVGEVVVRGPSVIEGYAPTSSLTPDSHTDGWFRTGDLGSLDAAGYLTLHGRIKEIINVAGEKVSPFEVEEVVGLHPAVAEAVAFAAPDHLRGEQVCVAVVLHERADRPTDRDLQRFAAETLAPFKVPRRFVLMKSIPLGPTGKVQRARLAAQLGLDHRGE